MKITMRIPMEVDDQREFQNIAAVTAMAQAMDNAGIDACHITDHPAPTAKWRAAGGHDALDPFTGLAFVAAVTRRLKLHTNLVVLPYRNPFVTAKAAATLDVLSEGRLILGVGVGYLRGEYEALGVDFETRGALMDEAIDTLKMAWCEGEASCQGRAFAARGVLARPLPIQKPHPPIWAGGNSHRAIRRAAERCDGWSPFFVEGAMSKGVRTDEIVSLEDLETKVGQLQEHRLAAGRPWPLDICIAPKVPLQPGSHADAQRWLDDLSELAELGVTWTGCDLPHPNFAAYMDNLQWFAEEVVPEIHKLPASRT